MPETLELSVEFESAGYLLRGVVHRPVQAPPVAGLVFVHPFAEEKKCSHRTFVEMGRAAARDGWAVLRVDLRGCGDSTGEFEAADLNAWREDLRRVFALAPETLGCARVGMLGLRLGGTLAVELAEEHLDMPCLVLWEPVVEGERYLSLTMRRSMLRRKLTVHEGGKEVETVERVGGETELDFDGYLVTVEMQRQIAQLNLLAKPKAYAGPTLILNLSGREKVAPTLEKLASLYISGEVRVVRQEPLWSAVGLVDPTPTISATVEWLKGVVPGLSHSNRSAAVEAVDG
ncbi:MAG: alpha/beta fold hydrolase [Candidatus Zipacnadales bacterium]